MQAPNANAYAERWVRTAREECLDKLIIVNHAHLRQTLQTFIRYYNTARPHQGIQQAIPQRRPPPSTEGVVRRRDILGGIIHDYYREAA